MALNVTFTPGNVMVAGVKWSVDDWNAALRGSVTITGSVGASDLADDAITFAKLNPNFILGGTVADDLASGDMIPFGQVDSADNRVITFQHFLRSIVRECTEVLTFADYNEDRVVFWRGADDLPVAMGVGRFFEQQIEQAPEITETNQDWEVLVRRSTEPDGSQVARTMLRHLLPDIITAKTVNMPTQIVVDDKGRVTSVSATEGTDRFTGETALPTSSGGAGKVSLAHGLGARPGFVQIWFKCISADGTWSVGDIIDHDAMLWDNSENRVPLMIRPTDTHVHLMLCGGPAVWISDEVTGIDFIPDTTKWVAIIEARR